MCPRLSWPAASASAALLACRLPLNSQRVGLVRESDDLSADQASLRPIHSATFCFGVGFFDSHARPPIHQNVGNVKTIKKTERGGRKKEEIFRLVKRVEYGESTTNRKTKGQGISGK